MMEETQYFDILTPSQEKLAVIYSFQELVLLLIKLPIIWEYHSVILEHFTLILKMDMYGSQKVFFENIELSPDSYKKMATLSKRMFDIFEGIHDSFYNYLSSYVLNGSHPSFF